ncbi:unnamed protein product [Mytilus coruscus]|uniref:Apple domain-containing protein n=1 Tax=Mytilus coruscus TaxID=42192 RepID=A0A6J8BFR5_MYTCO|nr:unnamed protein product [Mytilus coruscus]
MEMQVSIKSTDKLIHSATVLSDIACAHWCLDTPACCSASYEMTTTECLLDSCCNPETFGKWNIHTENKYYYTAKKICNNADISYTELPLMIEDETGKSSREQECIESAGFIYNTTTDVCYHIGPEMAVNFTYINAFCPCIGSELIKIDSSKKQVFVEEISGSSSRLCIQGNNDNTDLQFRFDNGSQMNYFLLGYWTTGKKI